MTEMQITTLLVGAVFLLLVVYLLRRRSAARREILSEKEMPEKTVSYETGRDERQWRRAYSRG